MALTLTDTVRNAIVNAITALLNSGNVQFQTSGNVAVATIGLGATAFASASAGVATMNSATNDTNAVGGTVAKAIWRNSSNTEMFRCTISVDGGGGDIQGPGYRGRGGHTDHQQRQHGRHGGVAVSGTDVDAHVVCAGAECCGELEYGVAVCV